MEKKDFARLFKVYLEKAALDTEKDLKIKVPREFQILLFGAGHSNYLTDVKTATDILYLGKEKYYRIIDIGVIKVTKSVTVFFVRASSHEPSVFEKTWNNPPGAGPFKLVGTAKNVKVEL